MAGKFSRNIPYQFESGRAIATVTAGQIRVTGVAVPFLRSYPASAAIAVLCTIDHEFLDPAPQQTIVALATANATNSGFVLTIVLEGVLGADYVVPVNWLAVVDVSRTNPYA